MAEAQEQLVLGVYTGGFEEDVKGDWLGMALKQICARDRLKEMKIEELVTAQPEKSANAKALMKERKIYRSKIKAAAVRKWRKSVKDKMEKDGLSVKEIMKDMVPVAGASKKKGSKAAMVKAAAKKAFPSQLGGPSIFKLEAQLGDPGHQICNTL